MCGAVEQTKTHKKTTVTIAAYGRRHCLQAKQLAGRLTDVTSRVRFPSLAMLLFMYALLFGNFILRK
jgi:hypothetical protein